MNSYLENHKKARMLMGPRHGPRDKFTLTRALRLVHVEEFENKKPTNWWDRQNAAPLKVDPKQSEAAFWTVLELPSMPTGVADVVISAWL